MEISSPLQEFADHRTKKLPAYDHQEPFRWIADVAVIEAFESGVLDLPDFYFTGDDYRYRFEPDARQRFIEVLRERFNSGAIYKGRLMKWDTVIKEKTNELARYLSGRSPTVGFYEPPLVIERRDNRATREMILNLTQSETREHGIGKSTLHYLRTRAKTDRKFKVYSKVSRKIDFLSC